MQIVPSASRQRRGRGASSRLLVTAAVLAAAATLVAVDAASVAESNFLLQLYNQTQSANWITKTNWGTGNCCSWFGVTCPIVAGAPGAVA